MRRSNSLIIGVLAGAAALTASPTGWAQNIEIDPLAWDYGNVALGDSRSRIFTIASVGPSALTIFSVEIVDDSAGAYAITDDPGPPFELPDGESVEVEVTFAPPDLGSYTADLHIWSNAPDSHIYVGLVGEGIDATGSELFLVDFEGFAEETEIDDQYAALGVTFSIDGNPTALPIIAVEGSPAIGFQGFGDDTPMSDGIAGLTDPLVGGDFTIGQDIVMSFDLPVTSVRFFVVDIDGETYTARAFDGATEVASVTRSAGQPGTGNGVSTEFFLSADNITSIVLDGPASSGFAIDFLSFTRPCEGAACGPLIELAQESSPGAGDFDTNVLGTLLAYAGSSNAAAFYAYDVPEGESWNGQSLTPIIDRSHLLLADLNDGLSLFIVHDRAIPNDTDGGRAETRYELFGDADGMVRSAEDDPPAGEFGAGYTGDPGDTIFTAGHKWDPCCTDGLALSDLDDDWSMLVAFSEIDGNPGTAPIEGLVEWFAYSGDGTEIPLALVQDQRVRLRYLGPTCPEDCGVPADATVNTVDLLALLAQWGQSGTCDTDDDGTVNTVDLLAMLGAWGRCP